MTRKVAMIQLSMEQCWTENGFYRYIESYVKESKAKGAEILVFPEDIGFCIAWVKESKRIENIKQNIEMEELSIKSDFENFIDWIISKLNLRAMGEWLAQAVISRIVRRVFAILADKYAVVIVSGSIYARKLDGIYAVSYVFDVDGRLVGEFEKHKLVSLEKAWGVKEGRTNKPIKTSLGNIGVCICYDLDDPKFIKLIADNGADFIVAPSGGFRPYPNYPFDFANETPQIQRAKENNIFVLRPYCAGWIFPGLYFQGRTMAVDNTGKVIVESKSKSNGEVIVVDVEMKHLADLSSYQHLDQ
jgi:predicted amidohydrolase